MEEDVFIAAGQLDMTPSAPRKTPRITPRPAPVTTAAAGRRRSTRNSSQATTADTSSVDWRSGEGVYRGKGGEVTVNRLLSMALGSVRDSDPGSFLLFSHQAKIVRKNIDFYCSVNSL